MQNWRTIGPVQVKTLRGDVHEYLDLGAAIRAHYHDVQHMRYGRLRVLRSMRLDRPYPPRPDDPWTYAYRAGDELELRDELGMLIPLWRIQEAYAQINEPPRWRRGFNLRNICYWSRDWTFTYRSGPVPYTRKRRRRKYFRDIRTTQELRENHGLDHEEDMRWYGIRARGARRGSTLPDSYEDIHFGYDRAKNWKRYRRTQYREQG